MTKHWFKVNRVPPNTDCEACGEEITVEQQRYGQARQANDGASRHGSCQSKEDWESQQAWKLRRNYERKR